MVGWDEILNGGVSQTAVIMSWHGSDGGIKAAKLGNDAVMTPDGPLYLDAYQGDPRQEPLAIGGLSTLQMVYDYDPVGEIEPQERAHILGVQGNIWTEWIGSVPHMFYMALPRELAVSEDGWTPQQHKNWLSFTQRMRPQYLWLARNGYNYRIPNPAVSVNVPLRYDAIAPNIQAISGSTSAPAVTVTLSEADPGAAVYYTTDGSTPDRHGKRYTAPLHLKLARGARVDVRAAAVRADGTASTVTQLVLKRT
jgi:hexosaminidase